MRKDVYLHSVIAGGFRYSNEKTLEILEKILKSGELLSANLRGGDCRYNFCGGDYISLSDYEKKDQGKGLKKTYNSFYQYSIYGPSIMIPKNEIEVIEPIVLDRIIVFYSGYKNMMMELGLSDERYTDLEDEVQVKDRVSLDKMCGMTIPTACMLRFFKNYKENCIMAYDEIQKIRELFDKYGYDVPFYDIDTENPLETFDDVCETIHLLKKKN